MSEALKGYAGWLIHNATVPRDGTKTTSSKAARELSKLAALYIAKGEPVPEPLQSYLAHSLTQISDGEDANRALHLGGKTGQSSQHDPMILIAREWFIYCRVDELRRAGAKPDQAHSQVTDEADKGEGVFDAALFAGWSRTLDSSYVGKVYRRWDKKMKAHYRACSDFYYSLTGQWIDF